MRTTAASRQSDALAAAVRIDDTDARSQGTIAWTDVHHAWQLAQTSLRYADAIYVAAAERHRTGLLTADSRIERSGAPIRCQITTIALVKKAHSARHHE